MAPLQHVFTQILPLLLLTTLVVEGEVSNVATQWTQLLSQTLCKGGVIFSAQTAQLADLSVVQWQSLVALYGSGKKAAASQEAVVAYASHYVFVTFFPSEFVAADLLLKSQTKGVDVYEANQAREYAHDVASQLLRARLHDGQDYPLGSLKIPTSKQGIPGEFILDDPVNAYYYPIQSALVAQASLSKTYVIPDLELFRAAYLRSVAPPTVPSAKFTTVAAEIKAFGSATSTTRSKDQTAAGRFWLSTGPDKGAICSISEFYLKAATAALGKSTSLYDTVTTLAKVSVAVFDATVLSVHMQYSFRFWRPATAIQTGYGSVAADPKWTPLLPTPNHPEFPSVTATEAAAGAAVLAALLGDKTDFSVSGGMGATASGPALAARKFSSFSASAKEAADARIYAGAHYRSSTEAGLVVGQAVAKYVLENWGRRTPSGVLPEMQHLYWYSDRISTVGKPRPVEILLPKSGAKFYDPLPA